MLPQDVTTSGVLALLTNATEEQEREGVLLSWGHMGGLLHDAPGEAHFSPFLQSVPSLKQ